ncbi:uncharacterized protein I206_105309 [Kwoniella pini CBS 10737]|uniref:Putative phospholipase n=1 Tax=Kwoniella pini CBS 10737 TaxID=1296096 RepID=A0A1B9I4L4_9TREE|nr:uncharacterized protein I206_03781 [Kwoniella pini CBS 10737]OCF50459.1 hypothetical protein I206_03781 [Kwoniella pini CBS 10737]
MPLPPLLSSNLPLPTGTYGVGYIPISHKSISPFEYSHPTLNETDKPALKLNDIGYSVFYPTDLKGRTKGISWVPEPFWGVIKGYELFLSGKTGQSNSRSMKFLANTIGYIAGRLRIPVHPYAPLLPPQSKKYPLVIFSHGLAGTRHTYSQFCAGLASEGYVVLAVEHKDGSGPAVCLPSIEGEEETGKEGKILHYIRQSDLKWAKGEDKSLTHFRTLQLDIRSREIYETYHNFKNLINNNHAEFIIPEIGNKEKEKDLIKKKEWIESLNDKVDYEDLRLTGHSFGGGTVLHILQTTNPSSELPSLPIKQVIALDPWLEPIPLPSSSTKSHSSMPPILVINSVGFTEWSTHFKRLVNMIKDAQGSLVTVGMVGHQSFSDFPLLDPRSHNSAKNLLNKIHDLSNAFLSSKLSSLIDLKDKLPDQGNISKNQDGKLLGGDKEGEIIVHLIGKE